ncbi:MAG TPA: hypothetical protein VNQ90_18615 [Chthoniobacteraceae bacterium]|nr:hypothetical protein [Chthoniobacteraceae bacterium]
MMTMFSHASFYAALPALMVAAALPFTATGREMQEPRLEIPRVDLPYRLDGILDEPFWQSLPRHGRFLPVRNQHLDQTEYATDFRVARIGNTLLFGVVCRQPEQEIIAHTTQRNYATVCSDDSVEIFLSPDESGTYQLAVNAIGTLYDQWRPREWSEKPPLWNGAWEAVVHRDSHQWSAEFAIPLAALNLTHSTTATPWRINVARTVRSQRVPVSWARVERGFADWKHHREAVFLPPAADSNPLDLSAIAFPSLLVGENSIEVTLGTQATSGPYTVRTSLRVWEPGPLPARRTALENVSVRNGKLHFPLELKITQEGQLHELIIELFDEQKKALSCLLAHTFYPPKPLDIELDWPVYFKSDKHIGMNVFLNTPRQNRTDEPLHLLIRNAAGKIVLERDQPVPSENHFRLEAPATSLVPGRYQMEIRTPSTSRKVKWLGTFHLVDGPF